MTFDDFYTREYLVRHADWPCRLFHVLGLLASIAYLGVVWWLGIWWLLLLLPLPTYLLAWMGHLVAHNQPTFFEHPIWSFFAYWKMIGGIVAGRV